MAHGRTGLVLILAVETATEQMACALGDREGVIASVQVTGGRRHVETLAPAIEFMCQQAHVRIEDVVVVAADVGPGLFSGLRVGVATAKALAQALRVPTVGVVSLDLLAFHARFSSRLIVSAIDARRGEIFNAFYRQVPGGAQRISPYRLDKPGDLTAELVATGEDYLLVGDAVLRYPELLDDVKGGESGGAGHRHPSVGALVELAHARAVREDFVPARELVPFYMRRSDAEINWDAAAARSRRETAAS